MTQPEAYQLLALKGALKMQIVGMTRRGPSALTIIKKATGLKARTAKAMLPLYEEWLRGQGLLAPVSSAR
jgi:hypothetical protein